jgi:hypothetical protein
MLNSIHKPSPHKFIHNWLLAGKRLQYCYNFFTHDVMERWYMFSLQCQTNNWSSRPYLFIAEIYCACLLLVWGLGIYYFIIVQRLTQENSLCRRSSTRLTTVTSREVYLGHTFGRHGIFLYKLLYFAKINRHSISERFCKNFFTEISHMFHI